MYEDELKSMIMGVLNQLLQESEMAHGGMLSNDLDTLGRDTKYDGGDQGLGEGLDIKQRNPKPDDDDEENIY